MVVNHRIQEAFECAKREFQRGLKNPTLFAEIQKTTRIEEVYDAAEKLQEEQAKRGHLRHLRRIDPYLERLRQYSEVIETFVQAKSDILALIWGPIRLLLQMSKNLTQSFDAIVNTMVNIGEKLPLFQEYTQLFSSSNRINDVLCLFFKDILDFYLTALNFFGVKRWELLFESVWPRHKARIELVATNIERHGLLMFNEVNLEHITKAHDARNAALDHYERTREFQERQDFEAVDTYIRPRLYDNELDRLRRTYCKDTGRWLQKEKTLFGWLDPADAATRLVWLQGIPGAGKTYLSSEIVEKARTLSRTGTLFAFLSYKDSSSTSTISILHSLIFQLVSEDRNLQIMLCDAFQSNRRDLKSNTKFAQDTFSKVLKCAGPTYIIMDGLDEITELERQMTLRTLLDILNHCDETKLLVSSRIEDDIARIVKDNAQSIRVDHKNAGCLQAYITSRAQQWLHNSGFDEQACSEVKALLAPLAAKAKGMFLYARIVMDSITMCYSLELIRSELRILPESLEEAYARVLGRLNNLQPLFRERARRVLGWIGCSPVPLTRHEVEQALCIVPGRLDHLPQVQGSLNIAQLCGPIVEVFDDYLYFVHFTVMEYLFSQQTDNFVGLLDTAVDLATTCLTYLCLDIFDPEIEEEDLTVNILSGGYRLHAFATSQWVGLVRKCAGMLRNRTPPDELITSLEHFITERENMGYKGLSDHTPEYGELKPFKGKWPKLHTILCRASEFCQLDVGDWRFDEDDSWANSDPFTLSYSSVRIYEQFEAILCPRSEHATNCNCSKLKSHYGARLFRCKYVVCHSQRIAFETRSLRDSHAERHDRPFKCTVPTCAFATMGFQSQNQFQKHWLRCHQDAAPKPNQLIDDPDDDEIQPLLFDLVTMGKLDEVDRLLPRFRNLPNVVKLELRKLAAFTGSSAMVRLLIETDSPADAVWCDVISESMKGENIEVLSWAASELQPGKCIGKYIEFSLARSFILIHEAAMSSSAAEVLELWEKNFSKLALRGSPCIVSAYLIRAVKSPMQEIRLSTLWKERTLSGELNGEHWGIALKAVAETTCSIVLAKALVECGVYVDFKRTRNRTEKTALHVAATKTTEAAAELMKLLLLSGADPNVSATVKSDKFQHKYQRTETRTPSMERGAQNISKWLGMTWDQLVKWAEEQRQKGSQNEPGS